MIINFGKEEGQTDSLYLKITVKTFIIWSIFEVYLS